MMKTIDKYILKRTVLLSFLIFSFGILISCGSSASSIDQEGYSELKELVASRNFEIENEWANPVGGGRIILIGNPNHIKFQGDSVDVYLPYFGVRHSGGGYNNSEGGLKYKGPVREFEVFEKPDKGRIEMEFETDNKGEILEFYITLFPGNNATTNVNTTQRTTISYQGEIREIKED